MTCALACRPVDGRTVHRRSTGSHCRSFSLGVGKARSATPVQWDHHSIRVLQDSTRKEGWDLRIRYMTNLTGLLYQPSVICVCGGQCSSTTSTCLTSISAEWSSRAALDGRTGMHASWTLTAKPSSSTTRLEANRQISTNWPSTSSTFCRCTPAHVSKSSIGRAWMRSCSRSLSGNSEAPTSGPRNRYTRVRSCACAMATAVFHMSSYGSNHTCHVMFAITLVISCQSSHCRH
jgi:hypothetical protein